LTEFFANLYSDRMAARTIVAPGVLAALLAAGCYSGASGQDGDGDGGGTGSASATEADASGDGTIGESADESGESGESGDVPVLLRETSRYPRLSHAQWENTIQDLFELPETHRLSSLFIGDPISGGFDNNSEALQVSATLWTDYQRGAEEVAGQVAKPTRRSSPRSPHVDGDSDTKARAFVTAFGRRAYRRPLTAEEVARHLEIFAPRRGRPRRPRPVPRAASASSSRPCCSRRCSSTASRPATSSSATTSA
jgi:hypothetical protein